MTNIVQMYDADGNPFYPQTHIEAVTGYTAEALDPNVQAALDQKVDKVDGFGLSKNDYSDDDKAKVQEIDNKQDAILISPNGTQFRITVNDDGALTTEQVVIP